jgi:hypothetical protein
VNIKKFVKLAIRDKGFFWQFELVKSLNKTAQINLANTAIGMTGAGMEVIVATLS